MLNKEEYKDKIFEIACSGDFVAKENGVLTKCHDLACSKCDFHSSTDSCTTKLVEWLNSEYDEDSIDWSKVKVDTPILVKENREDEWCKRYFSHYLNGNIYAWTQGRTSWSADYEYDYTPWCYAKLV